MMTGELVSRVARLLRVVIGCDFEFESADQVAGGNWNSIEILQYTEGAKDRRPYIESISTKGTSQAKSFGFPIYVGKEFRGLAAIRGFSSADTVKLLQVAELLTLLLEHNANLNERSERLRMIEERLLLVDETSNVIPLRPQRGLQFLQVVEVDHPADEEVTSPVMQLPLLIEAPYNVPVDRVAIELHQAARRWAFVRFEDLPHDLFNSRKSLEELGSVTIFIRDLTMMTTTQQIRMAEYLALRPSPATPHVIASIHEPLESLVANTKILSHLAKLFFHTQLRKSNRTPDEIARDLVDASLQHILLRLTHDDDTLNADVPRLTVQPRFQAEPPTLH
jgi:hypothetical protein